MKKNLFILILVIFAIFYIFSVYIFTPVPNPHQDETSQYLRLHIRANSNSIYDQQTKYAVRNGVLSLITAQTKTAKTAKDATAKISAIKSEIECLSSQISGQNSSVEITQEQFPTREYNGKIIPQNTYTAVVINLGSGSGDNWWCVAFPPLCYIDGEEIEGDEIILKSKIAEIWDKYL